MTVVVAGLGNPLRRDDGVGPLVVASAVEGAGTARDVGPVEDPLDLLGRWDGADLAVVVDATRSDRRPGEVFQIELMGCDVRSGAPQPATSTHGIGLIGAWRMARAVGAAPARVVVVGVEGEDFRWGAGLSPAVAAAVPDAIRRVVDLVREASPCA